MIASRLFCFSDELVANQSRPPSIRPARCGQRIAPRAAIGSEPYRKRVPRVYCVWCVVASPGRYGCNHTLVVVPSAAVLIRTDKRNGSTAWPGVNFDRLLGWWCCWCCWREDHLVLPLFFPDKLECFRTKILGNGDTLDSWFLLVRRITRIHTAHTGGRHG